MDRKHILKEVSLPIIQREALHKAVKISAKKQPTILARLSSPNETKANEREILVRDYYEALIKDKDKKARLEELKPLLKMLRSSETTKEAIARYIEGRALELNGFIPAKQKRNKKEK